MLKARAKPAASLMRPLLLLAPSKAAMAGAARGSATTVARKATGHASAAPGRGRRPQQQQARPDRQHR